MKLHIFVPDSPSEFEKQRNDMPHRPEYRLANQGFRINSYRANKEVDKFENL